MEDLISSKINLGEELLAKLSSIATKDGVMKLRDEIRQEIAVLNKFKSNNKARMDQVSSSKLGQLEAIVDCALRPGVIAVYKQIDHKLVIDIVSEEGRAWTKVINKNPKYQSYGTIMEQAKKYLNGAKMNLCMDEPPKVIFEFPRDVDENIAEKLQALGVIVQGDIFYEQSSSPEASYYDSDYDGWYPSD